MAAKYWLCVAICFVAVSKYNCQRDPILFQRTCSLTAHRLPVAVGFCTDEDGHQIPSNLQSRLPSRSTCRVTCQGDAQLRFLICDDGRWHMTPNLCKGMAAVQVAPRRRQKRWFWIPLIIWWWRPRPGPPPDRSPPVVTCPMDIHKFSDPMQTSTKVYWNDDDASAYDSKDGPVAVKRASRKRSGYLFSEGSTPISYTATDRAGNMGTCVMTITVTTIRCTPGPSKTFRNGYYVCHPSADFVYGTSCNYGCYYGYKIRGSKHRECLQSGKWSTTAEPTCETVTCPPQTIAPDSTFICTDGSNFKSACSYTCKTGYDVKPGKSRVRVCAYDGQWRGAIPECVDSEPPKFTSCPSVKTYYTERSSSLAFVDWEVLTATDNSRESITPRQSSGISNTDYHPVGVYEIVYTAADSTGNEAKECKFKVVIKELKCFAQYPLPYMRVDCPNGYRHGSTCSFSCTGNYILEGAKETTCELANTDNGMSYPYWDMSSQPSCRVLDTCRDLTPPHNGALACDVWEDGHFCQMQCSRGTDLTRSTAYYGNLMVCAGSGDWKIKQKFTIEDPLPNCTESKRPNNTKMAVEFYYDGQCTEEDTLEQIKTNFVEAFNQSPFRQTLGSTGRTTVNVKVTCGSSDRGRRKRETRVTVLVDILLALDGDASRETFKEAETTLLNLYSHITDDIKGDNSKLFHQLSQDVRGVMEIGRPTVNLECPPHTFPSYYTYSCVGCGEGLYYSEEDNDCQECPVGTYQPEAEGHECVQCPDGMTTLQNKTTTVDRCLPMCGLGHFSANGVEPCSPCSQGQYADHLGSAECTVCSGGMTTVSQGSDSVTSCRPFDVAMSGSQTANVQLRVDREDFEIQNGFGLQFWFTYQSAGDVMSLASGDETILSFSISSSYGLQLDVNGIVMDVRDLSANQWYQIDVSCINHQLSVNVDGVQSLSHSVSFDANDAQYILVSMGGAGFEGSVSQLNIWESLKTVVSPSSHTCFLGNVGDIISWDVFTSANLSNSFIQIPSECDDTDECLSSPCVHGECNDELNRYTCTCQSGYHGDNCDVNIDDCVENECTNGGTCVDGVVEYTCRCTPEYTGQYCDANLVHGQWTTWDIWTECTTSCGPGERTRARRCDNPQPQNGGDDCGGSEVEVGLCNTGECPVCAEVSPPDHGDLDCRNDSSTRLCDLKCDDGYDFDRPPLPVYKCGQETGYEWSHATEDNPHGRFPNCVAIENPDELEVEFQEEYEDLQCVDDNEADRKSKVLQRVREESNSLPCIQDNVCYTKDIRVSDCDPRRRRKRETIFMGFTITLGARPSEHGLQTSVEGLNTAVNQLNSSAVAGDFTVNLDGVNYFLTGSPTIAGSATCPVGWTRVEFYCIPCGPGTFFINGFCERCDIGRYNNVTAATYCHACPKGKSTTGRSSLSIEECTVDVHVPQDFPLAVVVGVLASGVLVVAVVVAVYFYRKWKHQKAMVGASNTNVQETANIRFHTGPIYTVGKAWIHDTKPSYFSTHESVCATPIGPTATGLPPPYSQLSVPGTTEAPNTSTGQYGSTDISAHGAVGEELGTDTERSGGQSPRRRSQDSGDGRRTSEMSIQLADMNVDRRNTISILSTDSV